MVLGIADELDPTAAFNDSFSLGHILGSIVSSFGVDVGTNFANKLAYVWLRKDYNRVDVRQCCENFGALRRRHKRTSFSLQYAHGIVIVNGDDQSSAELLGSVQVPYVADVQQIAAAVGEPNLLAIGTPFRYARLQLFAIKYLLDLKFDAQ